jgi:ubiquinone/menaquinone biosynthesis C-methylase UbiE
VELNKRTVVKKDSYSKKAAEAEAAAKKSYGSKKVAKAYDPWTNSDNKDYKIEVKKILEIAKKNGEHKNKTLLDIGCGTGSHLAILKKHYKCVGIDPYETMLKIARKKCKGVKLLKADMRDFDLQEKFDIIICLYSAISYSGTYPVLRKTLKNMYNHLNNGGVLIIDPFFQKELELRKGNKLNKYFLYNEPDKWIKIMTEVGFKAKFFKRKFLDNPEKGLYIAIKK